MRIIILLDKSGSMENNLDQTIAGYNEFLENQKILNTCENCTVSLYTFSDNLETVYENRHLKDAELLTRENYEPDGCTALLDSMGEILHKLTEPERTIFLIITDGAENSSENYDSDQIRQLIESKQEYLETVYIGSNQDAILAANNIGSQVALNYDDNHTQDVYRNLSAAMTRVRVGNTPRIQFTPEEINSVMN